MTEHFEIVPDDIAGYQRTADCIAAIHARPGGRSLFTNRYSLEHFCRTRRELLVAAGVLIPGIGRRGNLYRHDFLHVALKIMAKERQGLSPGLRAITPLGVEVPPMEEGAISGPLTSEGATGAGLVAAAPVSTPSEALTPPSAPASPPTAAPVSGGAAVAVKAAPAAVVGEKKLPAWRMKLRAESQS